MEKEELTIALLKAKNWAKEICRDQRTAQNHQKRTAAELKRNSVLQEDLSRARHEEKKSLNNRVFISISCNHPCSRRPKDMLDQV